MGALNATCSSKSRLIGKTVVITGANTGIGKETARDLYYRGAKVILACRTPSKADEALEDIKLRPPSNFNREQFLGEPGELVAYQLDLSSFSSVRECARKLLSDEPKIHILINNAGVMMCPQEKTEDGNELQIQSNHLGHFLFSLLLLPKIWASGPGCRIINVSSLLHSDGDIDLEDLNLEKSYTPLKAYQQSKLANVLFSSELARKLKEGNIEGINTYSLHPGIISSNLNRHMNTTVFWGFKFFMDYILVYLIKNVEQGAQTSIYCAVDENAGKETGLYYKECGPSPASLKGQNEELAAKLWNKSLEMVEKDGDNLMNFFKKSGY